MYLIEDHSSQKPYDIGEFALQLKTIRIYRGYAHQNTVACKIKVSRQVFSLWELGKRLPTIRQIQTLANFFQVEIGYFFTPHASPCEYVRRI